MALKHNFIGALIGLLLFRSIWGAVVGWFVGGSYGGRRASPEDNSSRTRANSYSRRRSSYGGAARDGMGSGQKFLDALMSLAAVVMKADGRVTRDELDVVKAFLAKHFPNEAEYCLRTLRDFTKRGFATFQVKTVASRMSVSLTYGERLVLMQFLVEIANADGNISYDELMRLRQIASGMNISQSTLDSIIAMFVGGGGARRGGGAGGRSGGASRTQTDDETNDYAILEVSPSASDDEIKRSFRKLAMKHHPDRVATASPAVQKAAAEKFKKISAAYERICKRRRI